MKIVRRFFLVLILISSICIISCSDSSNDDDPDPYLKFSVGENTYEWVGGFTDYEGVPEGSRKFNSNTNFNAIALKTSTASAVFESNLNSVDHVCIVTGGCIATTYTSGMCVIHMRVFDIEGASQFKLSTQSIVLTKVTNSYVKGTFTGTTTSGKNITDASFVFKRTSDGDWPLSDPSFW